MGLALTFVLHDVVGLVRVVAYATARTACDRARS